MADVRLIIEERQASIGTFMVGRLLPFRQKRMVGPFIYMDHMGPAELQQHENFDVLPHPHIGLSTLTYLLEGNLMHRDSIGSEQEIIPGEVNWMTAGSGIVHSERTPAYLRDSAKRIHGLQLWIALPREKEQMAPRFVHIDRERIPTWYEAGLEFRLIVGEAFGRNSPVTVYSQMFLVEISSSSARTVVVDEELYGEVGMYILKGSVEYKGTYYTAGRMLVFSDSTLSEFLMEVDTSIYLLGGEPFEEERLIDWNFVASKRELIDDARLRWQEQRFDPIEGETEFVPLPVKL